MKLQRLTQYKATPVECAENISVAAQMVDACAQQLRDAYRREDEDAAVREEARLERAVKQLNRLMAGG